MDIRKKILGARDSLGVRDISRLSRLVQRNLESLPPYQHSSWPLFFASFRSEVQTISIIRRRLAAERPVLLPKTLTDEKRLAVYRITSMDDLAPGAYGILEPVESRAQEAEPADIDLVLVPGSVFDRRGGRYGYGGGYYDRFLSREAPGALRIALAFSFQVLDNIPLQPHDQLMDYIVTEREIIRCSRAARGLKKK